VFSVRGPIREDDRIREWELTSLEFRSSKGITVWPEESVNPQLSDSNKNLVVSPRWVLYSKKDWAAERR
jgi:hypothetical protein